MSVTMFKTSGGVRRGMRVATAIVALIGILSVGELRQSLEGFLKR